METEKDIKLFSNGGTGMVLTTLQPITKKHGITMTFSSNQEVRDFHKQLGDFIKKHCAEHPKFERYYVNSFGNFYDDMTGKKVGETDKTFILEFQLSEALGGPQRAQFFKHQLQFEGTY